MDTMRVNPHHITDLKALKLNGNEFITSGVEAPDAAPPAIGMIYIDTLAGVVYISTGTDEAVDWNALAEVA